MNECVILPPAAMNPTSWEVWKVWTASRGGVTKEGLDRTGTEEKGGRGKGIRALLESRTQLILLGLDRDDPCGRRIGPVLSFIIIFGIAGGG